MLVKLPSACIYTIFIFFFLSSQQTHYYTNLALNLNYCKIKTCDCTIFLIIWSDLNLSHSMISREKHGAKCDILKLKSFNRKLFCLKHLWIYNSEMYMMYARYIVWPIQQSASLFSVVSGQLMTRCWTKNNASLGDYFTANIPQHLIKRCLNLKSLNPRV